MHTSNTLKTVVLLPMDERIARLLGARSQVAA